MNGRLAQEEPVQRRSHWRRWLLLAIKLLLASGLFYWLARSGRLDFSALTRVNRGGWLVASVMLLFLSMALPVGRWMWLVRIQQIPLGFFTAFRLMWLGYFAGLFLPGGVSGDLIRAYAICARYPYAKTRAVSTILLDRMLGLHSMLFAGAVAATVVLAMEGPQKAVTVAWFAIALFATATAGVFVMLWRPTSRLALKLIPRRFREAFEGAFRLYGVAWRWIGLIWVYSLACGGISISSYYYAAKAIDEQVTWPQVMTVIPMTAVANTVPLTPSGLGIGESVGSELMRVFGIAQGALMVFLVRLSGAILTIPGIAGALGGFKPYRDSTRDANT